MANCSDWLCMKNLRPYYRYLKICKGRYILGIAVSILNGLASGLGMPFIAFKLLPLALPDSDRDFATVIGVVLLIPLIAAARSSTSFFSSYLMGHCNFLICMELRKKLMGILQELSLSFFHASRTGQIIARIFGDTSKIASVVTQSTAELVRQPVTILFAFGWIGYLAFKSKELYVLILVIAILPLCVFLIRYIGKRVRRREKQIGRNEGSLYSIVHENIEAAREVRAFNLQEREEKRFEKKALRQFVISMRLLVYKNLVSPSVEIVAALGIAGAIFYAAIKEIPLETIGPLLTALYVCYQPFKKLGTVYTAIQKAKMAANRIQDEILDTPARLKVAQSPVPCPKFQHSLSFNNVSFTYDGKVQALHDASTVIKRGEVVALVGHSGSGKSTFCSLISRFHDPAEGSIHYDDIGIHEFDENEYRKHIAIVPQDSFLFADSIINNIRIGRPDASDEEVIEAARKANAHDFIERLPEGYDTVVSERGISLSGGQRQRISIARAFLRDSEILILDEATSAIDAQSEEKIHSALNLLFKNKTVIIIAHRYSTIRMAERILLFNEGRIEMDGTSAELEAGSDFFRALKASGIEPGMQD